MQLRAIFLLVALPGILTTAKILSRDKEAELSSSAVNIIDVCFGLPETRASILLSENLPIEMYRQVFESLKYSVFTVRRKDRGFVRFESFPEIVLKHYDNYLKTQGKPSAVVMYVDRMDDLGPILNNMKFSAWRTWQNRIRYLIIVPRTLCNVEDTDQMFRVIWKYWILNAIILCSSDHTEDLIENKLFTYNPYSSDHSQPWKTIIRETVQVLTEPKNFSHSWHVFRQDLIDIESPKDCDNLFFDKTLNLGNYLLPINMFVFRPDKFIDQKKSGVEKYAGLHGLTLQTLAKKLRFNVVEVRNDDIDEHGQLLENGSYTGELKNAFHGLSNLLTGTHLMADFPGLEMTYPYLTSGACFASRFGDPYPLWTNIFVAREIWIGLGVMTLLVTIILYLHNKPLGVMAALLDAERFIVGNSIIRLPESIKYRFTFGSIFLTFVVLDGIFRGRFVSILASDRRYPTLDTLEQVKEQGVDIYGYGTLMNWLNDPVLKKRFHSIASEKCLKMITLDSKQRACLGHCITLPLVMPNSTMKINTAVIPILENYAVFISTLNWPLMDRWNFEVQKLTEAGFTKKWHSDALLEVEMESWKTKRAADQPYSRTIQLDSLLSAFMILFLGLATALLTFIWEIRQRRRLNGWRVLVKFFMVSVACVSALMGNGYLHYSLSPKHYATEQ